MGLTPTLTLTLAPTPIPTLTLTPIPALALPPPSAELAGSFDPSIVSTTGTVEGGVYSHRAAHFEWLCDVGGSLGMSFDDLGKRRHGTPATLHFCDKLFEIYGSEDLSVSLGASFAIEHWANAGFWDHLVEGFDTLNRRLQPSPSPSPRTPNP